MNGVLYLGPIHIQELPKNKSSEDYISSFLNETLEHGEISKNVNNIFNCNDYLVKNGKHIYLKLENIEITSASRLENLLCLLHPLTPLIDGLILKNIQFKNMDTLIGSMKAISNAFWIRALQLEDCAFLKDLTPAVFSELKNNLKELIIHFSSLNSEFTNEIFLLLHSFLESNFFLTKLGILGLKIDNFASDLLSDALMNCSSLEEISLDQSEIMGRGAEAIAASISKLSSMRTVSLKNVFVNEQNTCLIIDSSKTLFRTMLEDWKFLLRHEQIETLDLSDNEELDDLALLAFFSYPFTNLKKLILAQSPFKQSSLSLKSSTIFELINMLPALNEIHIGNVHLDPTEFKKELRNSVSSDLNKIIIFTFTGNETHFSDRELLMLCSALMEDCKILFYITEVEDLFMRVHSPLLFYEKDEQQSLSMIKQQTLMSVSLIEMDIYLVHIERLRPFSPLKAAAVQEARAVCQKVWPVSVKEKFHTKLFEMLIHDFGFEMIDQDIPSCTLSLYAGVCFLNGNNKRIEMNPPQEPVTCAENLRKETITYMRTHSEKLYLELMNRSAMEEICNFFDIDKNEIYLDSDGIYHFNDPDELQIYFESPSIGKKLEERLRDCWKFYLSCADEPGTPGPIELLALSLLLNKNLKVCDQELFFDELDKNGTMELFTEVKNVHSQSELYFYLKEGIFIPLIRDKAK